MKKWMKSDVLQYLCVTFGVMFCYLIGRILKLEHNPPLIHLEMLILLFVLCLFLLKKRKDGRLQEETLWNTLILMGFLMRIGYMLYTGCTVRSHDLWELDKNSGGHAAYILTLIEEGHLPASNQLQFYQQPLFYVLGAAASGCINGILGCREAYYLVDAAKTVSCAASCITLLLGKKILTISGVKGKEGRIPLLLFAFLPVFYLTGGRVNPDALAGMFMAAAFFYTIRWYHKTNWKNICILAVLFGCAMMTKISCGVIALFTAFLFLLKLVQEIKAHRGTSLMMKYIVFGGISLPLGLWYSIRNYRLFGQSLSYVPRISTSSSLYTGSCSLVQRMIGIDVANLFRSPYTNVYEDYNAPVYFLKSSLFGEFRYQIPGWIPVLLLLFAFSSSVACLAAWIWQIRKNRNDQAGNWAAAISILYYASILWFYFQYPFGCSMDFRYMIFLPIPLGVLLGKYVKDKNGIRQWVYLSVCGLSVCSCLMYCLI